MIDQNLRPDDPQSIALWAFLAAVEELEPAEAHEFALQLVTVAPQMDEIGQPRRTAVLRFLANYVNETGKAKTESDEFSRIVDPPPMSDPPGTV